MAIEKMSTRELVAAYNRIRALWRSIPWPKDDVWPLEHTFDMVRDELHRRGYFGN